MAVALYARVSSTAPSREESIDSQLAALYDYAQQKGYLYEASDVYADRGYSGQRLERPGLDALRDAIWQGRYDQVVIFAPDRLARHYGHQYLLLEEFSRHGCQVLFVHHTYGQSPEEQMLLQLQGIFSQYEHAKITERIRRGRLHQLQAGRAHYSTPPYGYVYVPQREGVPGRIEIHAAEAEVVRQIFHWLVDEALSSHQLAQRLNPLKIPTKHDCGYWQQSVVLSLLRNPLYKGTAYFHRYQTVEPTYSQRFGKSSRKTAPHGFRLRPREEWVPVETPAIVSAQLFEQAQEQLQQNSRFAKRNSRRQYLLSGLLECQLCGYRLCGKGQRQRRYYYCIGSKEQTRGEQHCVQRYVPAESLEELVWEKVAHLLQQPELILDQLQHQAQESSLEYQEQRRLAQQGERLAQQRHRLLDAYQNGMVELEELQRRRERIAERERLLQERLQGITERLQQVAQQADLRDSLESFARRIQQALESPSFEDKQRILRLVIERIQVGPEEITVKHSIPLPLYPLRTDNLHRGQGCSTNSKLRQLRHLLRSWT